eukprot:5924990-Prymnesium_polylepis.2
MVAVRLEHTKDSIASKAKLRPPDRQHGHHALVTKHDALECHRSHPARNGSKTARFGLHIDLVPRRVPNLRHRAPLQPSRARRPLSTHMHERVQPCVGSRVGCLADTAKQPRNRAVREEEAQRCALHHIMHMRRAMHLWRIHASEVTKRQLGQRPVRQNASCVEDALQLLATPHHLVDKRVDRSRIRNVQPDRAHTGTACGDALPVSLASALHAAAARAQHDSPRSQLDEQARCEQAQPTERASHKVRAHTS